MDLNIKHSFSRRLRLDFTLTLCDWLRVTLTQWNIQDGLSQAREFNGERSDEVLIWSCRLAVDLSWRIRRRKSVEEQPIQVDRLLPAALQRGCCWGKGFGQEHQTFSRLCSGLPSGNGPLSSINHINIRTSTLLRCSHRRVLIVSCNTDSYKYAAVQKLCAEQVSHSLAGEAFEWVAPISVLKKTFSAIWVTARHRPSL